MLSYLSLTSPILLNRAVRLLACQYSSSFNPEADPRKINLASTFLPTSKHSCTNAAVASTPRVIINNSIYRQRQNRDQQELVFESRPYATQFSQNSRPRPRVLQSNPPNTTRDRATSDAAMCVNEIFTEMRPDGRTYSWSEPEYCHNSRHGQLCDRTKELRRQIGYRRPEPKSPLYTHLPPTPPLSHHSDYASDSERSSKRRSATYINDRKVIDINRRRSVKHERQSSGERSLYDNSPLSRSPLSRSPPLYRRSSVSSSPARDAYDIIQPSSYRDVDDRERHRPATIKVEIIAESPKTHHRKSSSSKTSSSRDSIEEDRRQRRLSDVHHKDQHQQRVIARQNEAIANRAPPASSATRYRRGSVSIISPQEHMRLEEAKKQRLREKREEEAREAEKQRLKDRFIFKSHPY